MIPVDAALDIVLKHTPSLGAEEVPLTEALGRVLAEDVSTDSDLPPFDRSAMDGYAVRAADVAQAPVVLDVAGQIRAGQWPDQPLPPGQAVQVMTGAPVPAGATAVQPVEKTRAIDGGRRVEILEPVPTGAHIARQGAEGHAGDEVLARGSVLDPASVAVLAAVGKGKVLVGRRPTVSVLVTGDELVDVWDAPTRGRIRNSNGYALMAQARWAGADARSLGVVPDQAPLIAQAVREGFASDVLVISGGVSEGAFDLVEEVLTRFDVGLLFTKVAIKPGAPLVFGRRGDKLIFGLPGNPVSAQVTFDLFARAALLRMQGAHVVTRPRVEVELLESVTNRSGRRNHLPARVRFEGGRLVASPLRSVGSADVVAHARANALVVLESERLRAEAGEKAPALLLGNFLERDGLA
ncbi:MAG: molybdopterin molybdenumtransferase MoeA [Acidobacteria bacterium]|nr:MAG: molybdopterin molybdenumtransferase MoeA [Acidobacteriota bacterium]